MASRKKPVLLMAGRFRKDMGMKPFLKPAMAATGKPSPTVLQITAASGDDRGFGTITLAMLKWSGAGKVLWPKVTGRAKDPAGMREALGECDLVFVSGGDVEEGMKRLQDLDLVKDLKAAASRGAVITGLSAGAIMLGERWVRWPREDAGDDEAETFPCLGIAPVTVDTHGEKEKWNEVRAFVSVRARETGKEIRGYGIPSGGALSVPADAGAPRALEVPAQVFEAKKGEPVRALPDLHPHKPEEAF